MHTHTYLCTYLWLVHILFFLPVLSFADANPLDDDQVFEILAPFESNKHARDMCDRLGGPGISSAKQCHEKIQNAYFSPKLTHCTYNGWDKYNADTFITCLMHFKNRDFTDTARFDSCEIVAKMNSSTRKDKMICVDAVANTERYWDMVPVYEFQYAECQKQKQSVAEILAALKKIPLERFTEFAPFSGANPPQRATNSTTPIVKGKRTQCIRELLALREAVKKTRQELQN